jgi:hypothetical protein
MTWGEDGWWRPDPERPTEGPNWPPIDLEKSGLSQLIEMRRDGSMRMSTHPGDHVAEYGTVQVAIPKGQARYVMVPEEFDPTSRRLPT